MSGIHMTISQVSLPLAGRGQGWGVPYALTDGLTR